jgi:hypothetical protein
MKYYIYKFTSIKSLNYITTLGKICTYLEEEGGEKLLKGKIQSDSISENESNKSYCLPIFFNFYY